MNLRDEQALQVWQGNKHLTQEQRLALIEEQEHWQEILMYEVIVSEPKKPLALYEAELRIVSEEMAA